MPAIIPQQLSQAAQQFTHRETTIWMAGIQGLDNTLGNSYVGRGIATVDVNASKRSSISEDGIRCLGKTFEQGVFFHFQLVALMTTLALPFGWAME